MSRLACLLAVGVVSFVPSAAAASPVPPVLLDGPEVYKLDWNTRGLIAHDLDGDGLMDLAVLNNDRAKIDLLYQRKVGDEPEAPRNIGRRWEPVLEDNRFRRQSIVTGGSMYALAAGDLNGDGKPDLVLTGKGDPLTVLYQKRPDDWSDRRVIEIEQPVQWTGSLSIGDLDADGRNELVVLAKNEMLVFRQDAEGELSDPRRYPLSDEGCYGLVARDLDGDGHEDLMYLAPNSQFAWRVRLQRDRGDFGPERSYRVDTPAAFMRPIDRGANSTLFATVQRRTRLLQLLALTPGAPDGPRQPKFQLRPQVVSIADAGNQAVSYAMGDFDGDGGPDLAVGNGRAAEVQLFLRSGEGFAEPTAYPSLPDLRSIAAGDIDGDGRSELFVLSSKEGTVGVSNLPPGGRLSYPEPLPTSSRPLALAVDDLNGDGNIEVVYVYDDDGTRGVGVLGTTDGGASWTEDRTELEGLRTDPAELRLLDANQDGRLDMAIFVQQSPMRLLLQQEDGTFVEVSADEGFRPGLVDKLRASAVTIADLDGDGKDEMIAARKGFARSLRVGPTGELEVLDQFNAKDSSAVMSAAIAADLDGDGVPEILLVEEGGDSLQLLRRDKQGVYRYRESIAVGSIEFVGSRVLAGDSARPELLIFGKDRFWWIPVNGSGLRVDEVASYETDLPEMNYVDLTVGDLNGDGLEEIVVVDSSGSRILEILTSEDERNWKSALHFTIFESDPHYEGRRGGNREPRELLIADLTADGKDDLALLIHDRVLVFAQR